MPQPSSPSTVPSTSRAAGDPGAGPGARPDRVTDRPTGRRWSAGTHGDGRCARHRVAAILAASALVSASAAVAGPVASALPAGSSVAVGSGGTVVAGSAPTGPADPADPVAAAAPAADPVAALPTTFDLQAHRGGRGEHTEECREAFTTAVAGGVTTLELDVVMSADGVPVVWHDPALTAEKCRDTAPATPGDPQFPYVGRDIHDLTWDQIRTVRCDLPLDGFPAQTPAVDNRVLQLADVAAIAATDPRVHLNIETKIEADEPSRSAPPEEFVDAILGVARAAGVTDRIMVQSFDWRTLPLVRAAAPGVPLVALWDATTWVPGSPWLGGVDPEAVGGDVIAGAQAVGANVLSPGAAAPTPWIPAGPDGLRQFTDRAHAAGVRVVPWTVNTVEDMEAQLDGGVDGIITDYPTRLRGILDARGIAYRA